MQRRARCKKIRARYKQSRARCKQSRARCCAWLKKLIARTLISTGILWPLIKQPLFQFGSQYLEYYVLHDILKRKTKKLSTFEKIVTFSKKLDRLVAFCSDVYILIKYKCWSNYLLEQRELNCGYLTDCILCSVVHLKHESSNSKARHTPCDFCLLLDAETTKRRKSHGVCTPKTIVVH